MAAHDRKELLQIYIIYIFVNCLFALAYQLLLSQMMGHWTDIFGLFGPR